MSTKVVLVGLMSAGTVMGGAGIASAKGRPVPVAATGTATCTVQGSLTFDPPLLTGATGDSTVGLHAQLVRCSIAGGSAPAHGKAKGHAPTGHINLTNIGSIPTSTCALPSSAPTWSGLPVRWTPPSKVAGSSVDAASAGTITTQTDGTAQVAYTGLSVTGSFVSTTGTLTLNTKDTVANLQAACTAPDGTGLAGIAFTGSAGL